MTAIIDISATLGGSPNSVDDLEQITARPVPESFNSQGGADGCHERSNG